MRLGKRALAIVLGTSVGVGAAALALALLPSRPGPASWEAAPVQGTLVDEAAGPIEAVAFHYTPGGEPVFGKIYEAFLPSLDPKVRLLALVPPGQEVRARLDAFVAAMPGGAGLAARIEVAVASGSISPWSKDRALVAVDHPERGRGAIRLLAPAEPVGAWPQRLADWNAPMDLARAFPADLAVSVLPLDFDAGDFAITGGRLLVDVNLVAKNAGRGLDTPAKLARALERVFGMKVVVLGEKPGDVPRHHLSMYLTPLTDRVVLLGDPREGREIVGAGWAPGEASPDAGEPLRADFSDEVLARYDRASQALSAAGFEVARIPTVPFDDKTYLAYTNGIFETRGGRKIAWMPTFGLPDLDARARTVYEGRGWEVRPVPSRAAFPYHGTVGCLVNVLARGGGE